MTSFPGSQSWDIPLLQAYDRKLEKLAHNYGLDTFPKQYEIVTYQQMLESQAALGLPILYPHWSFGKKLIDLQKQYQQGLTSLAYEMVINANPCIAYLMADNSFVMQVLVMAHAGYGHNSFFKNNYLFREWTHPDAILDYLIFARNYVADCETHYGSEKVSALLDSCHALMPYGVEPTQSIHAPASSSQPHSLRATERTFTFPIKAQENLLYCIEKSAVSLAPWEREIIRIVRKLAHYFYPQRRTKLMNEGWACFWHYQLLQDLHQNQDVDAAFMMEFFRLHSNVLKQPAFDDPNYHGLNPYVLGFNIFKDLKRICTNPTPEDCAWFPQLIDQPWLSVLDFAMRNFSDSDFIAQYLSPTVMREMKLFALRDDSTQPDLEITAIHDEQGYAHLRTTLARQYELAELQPRLTIIQNKDTHDHALTLEYQQYLNRPLHADIMKILAHMHALWRAPIELCITDQGTILQRYDFPFSLNSDKI